ncbi:PilZ domain-containing protein [Devosia sp. J2-20]|uniref:PilZ domain-containing protein n=1 Tax=Devosia litorisediminis TaxID=2829817 RepID=A0A942ID14_9HYPH|nr:MULTISPECIES: PilZ domain-containing protein [Devosia]MBS3848229.1 PilZ domain-containing protein [Devosia litorisediminis]WDQ98678.1 PilZ domain-containing protein [Devosia sp. J2-20]|eukprot:GHVR01072621.1.p2 GENE.GHVR01072621.1~~GHVR01072621.1.p2  ORF type:complete len:227 (-),score=35.06 GHVR01072621.1:195-875(-)
MSVSVDCGELSPRTSYDWHDVRFIGAVAGRYALSDRKRPGANKAPVYACRLCSVSTRTAVVVGPVVGEEGEVVTAHFDAFGILRGRINRQLPSGFVMDLMLNTAAREKLGRKIVWQKKRVYEQVEDRREHKRIQLRDPRTIISLGDGSRIPCFVIDVSKSGIALSAQHAPEIGTPLAVGKLVGRVVRYLDVGFAVKFLQLQELEDIEALVVPPEIAPLADSERAGR